jgi:DNA (cytosine-5)-methyltransferase 1
LLDLFCGAGGAARGYQLAGFHVTGVDIKPQPRYAGDYFIQADALDYLDEALDRFCPFNLYDVIHASPPCQRYAGITKVAGDQAQHPDLIAPTRGLLIATGLPYVIENVPDARRELVNPIYICGSMFDPPLDVKRHRYFEANWPLEPPTWPCRHKLWDYRFPSLDKRKRRASRVVQVHGGGQMAASRVVGVHGNVNYAGEGELRKRAMGIDWMTQAELSQAIPPAYTEFIGHQLLEHIGAVAA